ncbi:MAG: VWA domain-containing protein [Phycisphaeraceae bacterium]|nr:VWA domain-containing protein [Phycisphaeraceae bacterium]
MDKITGAERQGLVLRIVSGAVIAASIGLVALAGPNGPVTFPDDDDGGPIELPGDENDFEGHCPFNPFVDCNGNAVLDYNEINADYSLDCNGNCVLDSCEIADGAPDVNADGVPDECQDCNRNGVVDEWDLDPTDPDGDGWVSADCNSNGIPDECEGSPFRKYIFIIDGSSSVTSDDFVCQINAVKRCLEGPRTLIPIDGSLKIAVLQFGVVSMPDGPEYVTEDIVAMTQLSTLEDLGSALSILSPNPTSGQYGFSQIGGATSISTGLGRAYELLDSSWPPTAKLVLLFTDGQDNDDPQAAIIESDRLRADLNARVCIGGIGNDAEAGLEEPTQLMLRLANDADSSEYVSGSITGFFDVVTNSVGNGCDEAAIDGLCQDAIWSLDWDLDADGVLDGCFSPADANHDGTVDVNDIAFILLHFDAPAEDNPSADVNGDGLIDINDLSFIIVWEGE